MHRTLLTLTFALAAATVWAGQGDVRYPDGYRDWRHVKSMVINQGHPLFDAVGGMHHIYANPKALAGYDNRRFSNGSVLVFDLFDAVDKDKAVAEGQRKAVIVMERDSSRFKDTDGWGYQVFDPATRKPTLDAKAAHDCHVCHLQQKERGFVFSAPRD